MTRDEHETGDGQIGAWLDGELDKDGAARMNEIVASDEMVAARANRLRYIDSLVRAAVPEEDAVPAELLERLGLAAPAQCGTVVDLADARRARAASQADADNARRTHWLRSSGYARIAAQLVLVAGLGLGTLAWLSPRDAAVDQASYRTLSDAPSAADAATAGANALVMFADGTDAATARRIGMDAGARLVGEPNSAGAWRAVIAADRRDAVLDRLRHDNRVTMAEAIDGTAP